MALHALREGTPRLRHGLDLVRPNYHAQLAVAIHLYLKTCSADALGGLRRDHIFSFGDIWIFNAALGLLKFLEPHLLLQDDMILGKLLKSIVPTRLQFEGGAYPPEAYETLRTMTDVPFAVGEEFASKPSQSTLALPGSSSTICHAR